MSVRNREELRSYISELVGERTDDRVLEIISDIEDTIDDYEAKAKTDWEKKFNENDAAWRKRYRDRFFRGEDVQPEGGTTEDVFIASEDSYNQKTYTFDELFKED